MIVPRDADPGVRMCSEAWADCLREGGLDVTSADVEDISPTATAVIVAPHRALRPFADEPLRVSEVLRRAVCVSTSRLGSGALGADRPFHRAAPASVALSRDAARYLSARGVATAHLAPGAHDRLRAEDPASRAFAIGTHARYSRYREDLLARSRTVLDPYTCDLRISHSAADRPQAHLAAREWLGWLASLDVLVSLPSEPGPGSDWCELVPAVLNGAVVVTTAESDFGPLEPGESLATATGAGFADAIRRLLADDGRRERMRASALARMEAAKLDVSPLAEAIAAVEASSRRTRAYAPAAPAAPGASAPAVPDGAAAQAAAEAARTRRAAARSGGDDRVTTTAAWDAGVMPAISVVIPSFGQAAFVVAAVESALAAVAVDAEIVVIDDHSADGSADLVRALLEARPERSLKLVEQAANAGLAATRNRGFRETRAPLVLLLDADDELLPHGPAALLAALEADTEAAFAYGFTARFGPEYEDLLGTEPWDPALFRHGNYIPVTCSLVRRPAWEAVGGYSAAGLLELGWEDLDFWLRLAAAGSHGAQVRRIVGSYRVHGESMSTVANRHAAALMEFLRERHPATLGADDA
jgi:GT2 family glycosyltransferase